jgi:hypothetical protein
MAYKFQLGAYTASGSLKQEGALECETSITIGSAELTEAELEKLDGITNGTAAANKALVADANVDISGLRNVTGTGAITAGTSFIIGSADLNEADMEKLDGITDGTAAANKALVVDSNKDIGTIRNLTIDGTFSDGNYTFDTSGNVTGLGTVGCGQITSTGTSTFAAGVTPAAANGAALGSASKEWSDLYLHDGGIVYYGADQDVRLSHVADSGLLLESTNAGNANAAMLKLQLSSSTPADNDEIGKLVFSAFDDGGSAEVFGQILMKSTDVSNGSEDGSMEFATIVNGSPVSFININGTAASTVTFVDGAYDVDFASHDGTNGVKLGGTLVTSTAAELNKLTGATVTTAEINYLDITTLGSSEASKALTADASGDITIVGASGNILFDKSANDLIAQDGVGVCIGTGTDLRLIHQGGQTYMSASAALNVATLNSGVAVNIGHATSEVTIGDNLTVTGNLTVNGTTVTVDSTTIAITGSIAFEGSTTDGFETTLGVIDPTADRTINLANVGGTLIPFAAASTTQIASTPGELNLLDGSAKSTSSITIDDADAFIVIDGNTTKQIPASDLTAYIGGTNVQNIDNSGTLQVGFNYWSALGGAESCTLPASPTVGNIVYVKAPSNCSSTNTITINKAGSQTIDGETAIILESPHAAVNLAYVAANVWKVF